MCKICVQQGDEGAFQFIEDKVEAIDKEQWKGIAVYVDYFGGGNSSCNIRTNR